MRTLLSTQRSCCPGACDDNLHNRAPHQCSSVIILRGPRHALQGHVHLVPGCLLVCACAVFPAPGPQTWAPVVMNTAGHTVVCNTHQSVQGNTCDMLMSIPVATRARDVRAASAILLTKREDSPSPKATLPAFCARRLRACSCSWWWVGSAVATASGARCAGCCIQGLSRLASEPSLVWPDEGCGRCSFHGAIGLWPR